MRYIVFIERSAIDFGRDDRRAKPRRIIKALEIITRHWKYRECPDTPEETGWSEFNGGEQRWTTRSRWHGLLTSSSARIRRNSRQPVSWTPWNSIITRQLAMIKIFRHLACTRHINIPTWISGGRPTGDRARLYGNVKAIERERERTYPRDRSRTPRKFVFFL